MKNLWKKSKNEAEQFAPGRRIYFLWVGSVKNLQIVGKYAKNALKFLNLECNNASKSLSVYTNLKVAVSF